MKSCVRHQEYQKNPLANYCGNCGEMLQRGDSKLERAIEKTSNHDDFDGLKIVGLTLGYLPFIAFTTYSVRAAFNAIIDAFN